MADIDPEIEAGTTRISLENVIRNIGNHGVIVGVLHRIDPKGNHTSKIYHADGFVFECNGFGCGYSGEGARGLRAVVQMIPYLAAKIGDEEIAALQKEAGKGEDPLDQDKVRAYYIFRIPTNGPGGDVIRKWEGVRVLQKEIALIGQTQFNRIEEL